MRMAGPDVVLFVFGALLFGGAAYAIVASPGGLSETSAAGVFEVDFALRAVDGGSFPVQSFRQASVPVEVEYRNVTKLTFTADCADPASTAVPFVVQLEVQPPAGIEAPAPVSGPCGTALALEVRVADAPERVSVPGGTEAEARAALAELPNASRAVGEWTVTVSGGRGEPVALPAGDPGGAIRLTVETWEPRFRPVQR